MLNKLQLSIKMIKEATDELLKKLSETRKEEIKVTKELNDAKSAEEIKNIKNKLGI